MSFQSKGLWMLKDARSVINGDITYDNSSRIEPKRLHQWFVDGIETESTPNKKQAVNVPYSNSFSEISPPTFSPWENTPNFNSLPNQFTQRVFDTDTNITSGNTSLSFDLSISHNYGGLRKVKVSQVRDSDNLMSMSMSMNASMVSSIVREDNNNVIPMTHIYDKVNDSGISMGLTYGQEEEDTLITIEDPYDSRAGDNFVSLDQSLIKDDVVCNNYKGDSNTISLSNLFCDGDMGNNYGKGDDINKTTLISQPNNKGKFISMGNSFDKGAGNIITFGGCSTTYDDDDDDGDVSRRLMNSFDLLMSQTPIPKSNALNPKDLVVCDTNALVNTPKGAVSIASFVSKKKDNSKSDKKLPPNNNFPTNVRSLLSTGILDEVPVKYKAWSREKELHGVIKGSGYLCGCQSCNFSKVINAYELERHAGCKTKHPNNHIYFENGKTVYGIVQELRNTPQNMLFDVIQTITGSPINQKSFRIWKESFEAATRELERIYGKDERHQPLGSGLK